MGYALSLAAHWDCWATPNSPGASQLCRCLTWNLALQERTIPSLPGIHQLQYIAITYGLSGPALGTQPLHAPSLLPLMCRLPAKAGQQRRDPPGEANTRDT